MLALRRTAAAATGRRWTGGRRAVSWTLGATVRPDAPPPPVVLAASAPSLRRDQLVTAPTSACSLAPPLTRTAATSGSRPVGPSAPQQQQQQQQQDQQQQAVQFRVHRIAGDGACMFRAIVQGAQVVSRGKVMAPESEAAAALNLRLAVVQELRKRREEMEPFLPGIAADFDEYCRTMSHPMAWGGEPEMLMASHVLQRPITVFHVAGGGLEPIVTYGEALAAAGQRPICLLWSGAHYDLLVPAAAPTS